MTLSAVYVNHHTHAASIMLIVTLVESLVSLFAICHIILTFTYTLIEIRGKGNAFCKLNQVIYLLFIY